MSRARKTPADALAGMSEIDSAQVVRCARALLRQPWLRDSSAEGGVLPLVYRHRQALTDLFADVLGYRLVVRRGWARLHKIGRGIDGTRGEPGLSARTYAYLTLIVAVLESGGRQLLLSRLVAEVHAAAAEAGVLIMDDLTDRAALTSALRHLVRLGVIAETEGSVGSAGTVLAEGAEALITVDRDLLAELVSGPVLDAESPQALLETASDPGLAGPERTVRRMLVEDPAVFYADLPVEDADWLRARRRGESRQLEDLFGLITESRLEGIIATDPQDRLSDVAFPGQSTIARISLLALPELLAEAVVPADEESEDADEPTDGRVPVAQDRLQEICARLVRDYTGTWSVQETMDVGRLAGNVANLLVTMGVAGRDEVGNFWINPVAHRYAVVAEGAGPPPAPEPPPERTGPLFDPMRENA